MEKFSLLLEINQELLFESMTLQNCRSELKKEQNAVNASGEANNGGIDYAGEDKLVTKDYVQ